MKTRIFAVVSIITAVFFSSCGTTSGAKSTYYEDNISDFSRISLKNGIPVAFKKNAGSQISVLRAVFEGENAKIPEEASAAKGMTLSLMLHGSQKYPYQTIQRLTFEKSFGFTQSNGKEFSSAGFTCIKRDFGEALDILYDGLKNPLFLEKDFEQEKKIRLDSVQSAKNDSDSILANAISKAVFKNHPYSSDIETTEKILKNISVSDLKNCQNSLLNAARIKIVIVGNFSESEKSEIIEKLNDSFGSIKSAAFSKISVPKIEIGSGTVREVCQSAGETGYIEGLFACPERNSEDYVPYVIATMMIDDSIFKIVREQNGAVYSAGTGVIGASRFAGAVSLYKATKFENLGGIVKSALKEFPKTEKEIDEKLDRYKNVYITQVFDSARTASGIASIIVSSWFYRGSESEYLKRPSEVESVTAAQVMQAYKKYIEPAANGKIRWIVVSGSDSVGKFEMD